MLYTNLMILFEKPVAVESRQFAQPVSLETIRPVGPDYGSDKTATIHEGASFNDTKKYGHMRNMKRTKRGEAWKCQCREIILKMALHECLTDAMSNDIKHP